MEDSMLSSLFPKTHSRYTSLPILGDVLEDLCSWLQTQGYPPSAIERRIEAAPLLDECIRQRQIGSLSGCTANELRACLPQQKRWTPQIACALGRSLLKYLEERRCLTSEQATHSDQLIHAYCEHLERVRGFAASTIVNHKVYAGSFLTFVRYNEAQSLARLRITDLDAFVTKTSTRVGRITMQKVIAVMRSFMRFLASSGAAPVGLDRQLESPRHYRGERLVRALPWNDVLRLLKAIDRSTEKGCRDYAMLLLIAAYGLRRAEAASLSLDDIQWRAKVIRVPRPKIGAPLAVPLTDEVATALLAYLRYRPKETHTRQVFLRVRAPGGPIEPTAITDVFEFWAGRAGLRVPGLGGPHCLRHGLAMHLLRQQTPLKTIGDLLGHRSVESTGVYLRLQIADLRDVALPLPTGDSSWRVQP
jgi:site-specific recombinase XerD